MLETLVRLQVGSYKGDFIVITENLVGRDNQQERFVNIACHLQLDWRSRLDSRLIRRGENDVE